MWPSAVVLSDSNFFIFSFKRPIWTQCVDFQILLLKEGLPQEFQISNGTFVLVVNSKQVERISLRLFRCSWRKSKNIRTEHCLTVVIKTSILIFGIVLPAARSIAPPLWCNQKNWMFDFNSNVRFRFTVTVLHSLPHAL